MKLLITNLNRKTTEKKLHSLFTSHGIVESAVLVKDEKTGNSKGFGFVEMKEEIAGEKAIKAVNGNTVEGNKIKVKSAE